MMRYLLLVTALLCVFTARPACAETYAFDNVSRVVVIGDLHGDFDGYLAALREASLIDADERWVGGETHLVQLGDIAGRGPDAVKIMRHLMRLEAQANKAGGRVHVLVGNHEAMSIQGDLRYVHANAYATLKSSDARALRKRHFNATLKQRRQDDPSYRMSSEERAAWHRAHPLGFVEHRLAWRGNGELGAWVLSHPAAIRINDNLFVHGGISPALPPFTLAELNARVRDELAAGELAVARPLTDGDDGPLWYRGYAYPQGERKSIGEQELSLILARYGVSRIIVGHTPGFGTVFPRFDGKILLADSGISASYGGFVAVLSIEQGQITLLQSGAQIDVPSDEAGLLAYLEQVAAAVPRPAHNLLAMIEILSKQAAAEAKASSDSAVP